jgi:hypothetical protein
VKSLLIPALLALAFQSTSVFAAHQPSAEASIDWNAMTFTLFDLNPADGQLPSVVWSDQYGDTSADAHSYARGNDGIHHRSVKDSYHASSATSVVGSNAVTDYSTGTSTYNNQSLAVAANADTSTIPVGSSYVYNDAQASGSLHSAFSLSGAGVMVISVPYTLKVTGDRYAWDHNSSATMRINGHYSASDGSYSGSESAYKRINSNSSADDPFYSGIFTLAVANSNSLLSTSGYLDASLWANAWAESSTYVPGVPESYTYVSGVPEPETYAMMLAGLGLVGAMARRRTSKPA